MLCGNSANNERYKVQELQLGIGDVFDYQRCSACGSMQLLNVPENLSRYYPNEDYYSFNLGLPAEKTSVFKRLQMQHLLFGKHPFLGRLLTIGYKMNEQLEWLKFTQAKFDDAILDVGTGNGSLLLKYASLGYTNLTGIDPFLKENGSVGNVRILKKSLFEIRESFDIIMLHHSLEHMHDPLAALKRAYELLKPGGKVLVRIPVMGNFGWKNYKEYWCGLDAPRHIFIPSENALKKLAVDAGFEIDRFYYDSYDYVIWCSEQYKKGIALHAPNSQAVNPRASIFSNAQLKKFRKKMAFENAAGNGDMAALYLKKA